MFYPFFAYYLTQYLVKNIFSLYKMSYYHNHGGKEEAKKNIKIIRIFLKQGLDIKIYQKNKRK